jgi:hypothetical protein
MLVMLLWLGGPLVTFFTPLALLLFGTMTHFYYYLAIVLVLGLHPLPDMADYLNKSEFSMWLCKYPEPPRPRTSQPFSRLPFL